MPLLHPVPLESLLFCASKPQLLCALRLTVSTCNCLHGLAVGHCSGFACWCRKSEVPSSLHCPHLLPGKIQQPMIFSVAESQFSSLVWGLHKLEVKCTLQSSLQDWARPWTLIWLILFPVLLPPLSCQFSFLINHLLKNPHHGACFWRIWANIPYWGVRTCFCLKER